MYLVILRDGREIMMDDWEYWNFNPYLVKEAILC